MDCRRFLFIVLFVLLFNIGSYCQSNELSCWLNKAETFVGYREKGHNEGDTVAMFLKTTGLGEGYAYCAAFLNYNLKYCGHSGPDKAAWSPSWFTDCVEYRRAKEGDLESGQQFGLYFPHKQRVAHVGFIYEVRENTVKTIEGNTSVQGSREGDGVYYKIRPKRTIYIASQWAY